SAEPSELRCALRPDRFHQRAGGDRANCREDHFDGDYIASDSTRTQTHILNNFCRLLIKANGGRNDKSESHPLGEIGTTKIAGNLTPGVHAYGDRIGWRRGAAFLQ